MYMNILDLTFVSSYLILLILIFFYYKRESEHVSEECAKSVTKLYICQFSHYLCFSLDSEHNLRPPCIAPEDYLQSEKCVDRSPYTIVVDPYVHVRYKIC